MSALDNKNLYDIAIKSIQDLYGDKSVSISTCKENLNSLIGEIEIMLDCLDNDEETE